MAFASMAWRNLACLMAAGGLLLGLACSKGKDAPPAQQETKKTLKVTGTVTYVRRPLLVDASGIPTGLETDPAKFQTLPARHVQVRLVVAQVEKDSSGQEVTLWVPGTGALTSSEGKYTLEVEEGKTAFVEVLSRNGYGARVVADPSGLSSSLYRGDRPAYVLRKGPAGAPAGLTPGGVISQDTTVDFAVGLNQRWIHAPVPFAKFIPGLDGPVAAGSGVLAILDSQYGFQTAFGAVGGSVSPTFSSSDYHYYPGVREAQGTFLSYDYRAYLPLALDGGGVANFGSVSAAADNDDAFDEGVLFALYARNHLYGQLSRFLVPSLRPKADRTDLQDLHPSVALFHGLSDAMAACALKSPYLADVQGTTVTYRKIHLAPGELAGLGTGIHSASAISAATWCLALKAKGLDPTTLDPKEWAKMDPKALRRMFLVTVPTATDTGLPQDVPNFFTQLARLAESQDPNSSDPEPVDLKTVLVDTVLTPLVQPYGVPWPRPAAPDSLSGFLADWGADPDSSLKALPTLSFTMEGAQADATGVCPNLSKGEVAFARFTVTTEASCTLGVKAPELFAAGGKVEVVLSGLPRPAYLFQDASVVALEALPKTGAAGAQPYYAVRVRLLSPTKLSGTFPVTVELKRVKPRAL